MSLPRQTSSAREQQLIELAYSYVLTNGLADLSLRPLAGAIGSSPRVLLYLFGSKEGLIRALLARARVDERTLLEQLARDDLTTDLASVVRAIWELLVADAHRPLLTLWIEAYARSLTNPDGPWAGFARQTVDDWLDVLAAAQPAQYRKSKAGAAERSLALAVLRGALLDVLATGDLERNSATVDRYLSATMKRVV